MVVAPDFDRCASAYGVRARLQRDAARWLAEWLPAHCGSPALELGAGTGFFTQHILRVCEQIVATDASPRMVEAGREALPQARWEQADAANPPGDLVPYAGFFTCSLVQWLAHPSAAFRAWHDSAAPGAVLLGGWFVRGTMESFFDVCPEAAPFSWRSPGDWESLVAENGWMIKRTETRHFELTHDSSADMLREIHDVGAVVSRRLGAGRLRSALRENDRRKKGNHGLLTDFVFMRLEAVRQ